MCECFNISLHTFFLGGGGHIQIPYPYGLCERCTEEDCVMWDSGLRLKLKLNSWVNCSFWIELVLRTKLLIKGFGRNIHNWRSTVCICIHRLFFNIQKTLNSALLVSLGLFPLHSVYISSEKLSVLIFFFFLWKIDFSFSFHADNVLQDKGIIWDKK